jgi:hypothetical protein
MNHPHMFMGHESKRLKRHNWLSKCLRNMMAHPKFQINGNTYVYLWSSCAIQAFQFRIQVNRLHWYVCERVYSNEFFGCMCGTFVGAFFKFCLCVHRLFFSYFKEILAHFFRSQTQKSYLFSFI